MERLNAELELLAAKYQLLQEIACGKLGSSESILTYQPNGLGYATIADDVRRVFAWQFGSSKAIDTLGRLYRRRPFTGYWEAYHPKKTDDVKGIAFEIKDFLI